MVFPWVNNQTSQKSCIKPYLFEFKAFNLHKNQGKFWKNLDNFLVYFKILTRRNQYTAKTDGGILHLDHDACTSGVQSNFALRFCGHSLVVSLASFIYGLSQQHDRQGSNFSELVIFSNSLPIICENSQTCSNRLYTTCSSSLIVYHFIHH